jgi:RNA polymerase sporulation-specific sigma factor
MNKKYELISDEELVCNYREGDQEIIDYLMEKYKNLVRKQANSMYILGADKDDLIQEGMIGLFKAVRDYDPGRDASFFTFAELCITRQMYTAVEASGRLKHAPLNSYISLYATAGLSSDSIGEEAQLLNVLSSVSDRSPEDVIIDQENLNHLEEVINQELSLFEKQVLNLYLTGMSYLQIGKVLGRDEKSTDNALQRLKQKIKKALM